MSILKRILKVILFIHLFLVIALLFSYCSLKKFSNHAYETAKRNKPYDVIIVPGVPYEKENTTSVLKMRMLWAKHLYDSGFTKNIIFSGSSVYNPFVEGKAMKVIADSLGIPASHTFAEVTAEHSTENIYYSWKMAKAMHFTKVAVATDPFQAILLRSFTKKYCPGVDMIPIVMGTLDLDHRLLPVVDTTSFYNTTFVSIREREGFWKRFSGTRGRRIKDEIKAEEQLQKENTR